MLLLAFLKAAGALVIILAACELFTNAVEWFGEKLSLSKGAVGSVLAAVGTALPETLVPLVAILVVGGEAAGEVGVGGIVGAPFMLATLAFAVTGVAVLVFAKRRGTGVTLVLDAATVWQDLRYFLVVYVLAVAASPLFQWLGHAYGPAPEKVARITVAVLLLLVYAYYVWLHLRRKEEGDEECEGELCALYFHRRAEEGPHMHFVVAQLLVALVAIVVGAEMFVKNLTHVSAALAISPLVLSLIVTPIATELPEKFNSVLWVRQGKDTLAFGNVSGAMVFQSCIPVAVGVSMTHWNLEGPALVSAACALGSTVIVAGILRFRKRLTAWDLLVCGLIFYAVFLTTVIF
jgi:cation:H+ antiporter